MAHYFFDLTDGKDVAKDKVGLDLLDDPAARERARDIAICKVAQRQRPSEAFDSRELHVRATNGRHVAKIALRYVTA